MKIFVTILLFYFSFLIIGPVFCGTVLSNENTFVCPIEVESKCNEANESESKDAENENENNSCCSIQYCNCVFLLPEIAEFSFNYLAYSEKIIAQNENVTLNYFSSCWRPPKYEYCS